jgi:hypothetical protein
VVDDAPFFEGVDVEFLDGELVIERQSLPRWEQPADDWEFGGVPYHMYGFNGPSTQENGRQLFRVFVRPRVVATDPPEGPLGDAPAGPADPSPEPAPS